MAFIFTFDFAIEMLAAFVIFSVGYIALFVALMICLALMKGIYEGARWGWAHTSRLAAPNRPSIPSGDDKRVAPAIQ